MSILDTLRKLGIMSCGAKAAVYRDAKSRPTEFMRDDASMVEKDFTMEKTHPAGGRDWESGDGAED